VENPQILGAVGVRGKFLKTRELRGKETADPHGAKAAPRDDNKRESRFGYSIADCKGQGRGSDAGGTLDRKHKCGDGRLAAAEWGRAVVFMSGSYKVRRWIVERCDEEYGRR
jgi:hypothetical protein